ncbi:hypothetical protein F7R91_29460 [Streptomyces luteolifulvus]|uniref:Uncharacterized protein n=1 Tax=Streptomyces luteolifulvus TaxID=2615112 RepID=A0A6H9USL5_9ACTN|nr:hypothetical protein [Streptomyces luteolifulvus]KAB1142375.1 hypothetical protein F7R91_29460 [Streptomyces luteolifulvus]
MWNTRGVVPAVPIPVLPPPLPAPTGSMPLAGQRIAVLGRRAVARAVAAELGAKGAKATVRPPGHRLDLAADAADLPLDGVLLLLPNTPGNPTDSSRRTTSRTPSSPSDTITAAMLCSPRWLLVLAPRTSPTEAVRSVLALGS